MDKKNCKIGVFDSGLGGVTVLKRLLKDLPYEEYIYYGDSGNAPYGSGKTKEEIIEMIEPITKKFEGIKGIKYSIDYKDESFVETIEIDYENLDYEKAKVALDEEFQDPSKGIVSMKITEKALLEDGYVEQK